MDENERIRILSHKGFGPRTIAAILNLDVDHVVAKALDPDTADAPAPSGGSAVATAFIQKTTTQAIDGSNEDRITFDVGDVEHDDIGLDFATVADQIALPVGSYVLTGGYNGGSDFDAELGDGLFRFTTEIKLLGYLEGSAPLPVDRLFADRVRVNQALGLPGPTLSASLDSGIDLVALAPAYAGIGLAFSLHIHGDVLLTDSAGPAFSSGALSWNVGGAYVHIAKVA